MCGAFNFINGVARCRFTAVPSLLSPQGEFGSGLHRADRGAGTPAGSELQADGDPEESLTGAG